MLWQTKGSCTGVQCNEGLFDRKYVALSFPSHCRTKGTSHQIRVIRGFDGVNQLTEQNHLCHQRCLWPQSGTQSPQDSLCASQKWQKNWSLLHWVKSSTSLKIGTLQKTKTANKQTNKKISQLISSAVSNVCWVLRWLPYLRALLCLLLLHLLELYCVTINVPSEGLCSLGSEQVCVRSCTVCKSLDISVWPSFMGTSVAAAL